MSYRVYIYTNLCYHSDTYGIFIETSPTPPDSPDTPSTGLLYSISGSSRTGFTYSFSLSPRPPPHLNIYTDPDRSDSPGDFLGTVSHENFPRVAEICGGVPVPMRQFDAEGKRLDQGEGKLVLNGDWLKWVVQDLEDRGVLEMGGESKRAAKWNCSGPQ